MDLLIEFLVQLVIQFLFEIVIQSIVEGAFRGLARILSTRTGQRVFTAAVGLAFGTAWGRHLADGPHPPKLLWVSLALALAAMAFMRRSGGSQRRAQPNPLGFWQRALTPPWRWPTGRWLDFVLLNLAIAGGIGLGYSRG
jgi:hypothetical protein